MDILDNLFCKFTVIIETILVFRMLPPRTDMHLINRHRLLFVIPFQTLIHPRLICPFNLRYIRNTRRCSRSQFCIIRIWICFVEQLSFFCLNAELVHLVLFCAFHKTGIDSYRIIPLHHIRSQIPIIKLANDRYFLCVRCPHCKICTLFISIINQVCTQFFINLIMIALSQQILIQFANLVWFHSPLSLHNFTLFWSYFFTYNYT